VARPPFLRRSRCAFASLAGDGVDGGNLGRRVQKTLAEHRQLLGELLAHLLGLGSRQLLQLFKQRSDHRGFASDRDQVGDFADDHGSVRADSTHWVCRGRVGQRYFNSRSGDRKAHPVADPEGKTSREDGGAARRLAYFLARYLLENVRVLLVDPWFVYLARCADGTLYVGTARDVAARIALHDAGRGARYTRGRGPLQPLATRRCASKGDALRLELALKRLTRCEKLAVAASRRKLAALARGLSSRVPRQGAARTRALDR
jgi:putative endonuclease